MFCTKCGTELSDDSRFCNRCGAALPPLEKKDVVSPSEFEADTILHAQSPQETAPAASEINAASVESKNVQNDGTYGLLGFIFAFIFPIVGLVLSIIAIKQNSRKRLAIAGLVLSVIFILLSAVFLIGYITDSNKFVRHYYYYYI